MNNFLAWLLCVVIASSISTVNGCADQYGHCKEWSKAGFCNINGYKTYMTVMCAYSCNRCKDHKEVTRSSGEQNEDESGSSVDQAEDVSSVTEQAKNVNDAVDPSLTETTEKKQPRHSEEKDSEGIDQQERQQTAEQDERSVQEQQPEIVTTNHLENNQPGVREVIAPQNVDDNVDPRSKIAVAPVKNLKEIVKKLKTTITETTSTNQQVISGESQPDEMRDLAGEVASGSKIFEDNSFESESTSGCSSGYGCFSEPGEQVKEAQDEAIQQLESRSKIDVPESYRKVKPHLNLGLHAPTKQKTIDSHGEDTNGEAKNVSSIDISTKQTDEPKDIDHEEETDREKTIDKQSGLGKVSPADKQVSGSGDTPSVTPAVKQSDSRSSVTKGQQQPSIVNPKPIPENEVKAISTGESHSGSGDSIITIEKDQSETADKNIQGDEKGNAIEDTSENVVSGSGKGPQSNTESKPDSIDRMSEEDLEENINGIKPLDIDEEGVTKESSASGSSQISIDETQNDTPEKTKVKGEASDTQTENNSQVSGSGQQKEIEEDNIEDALFEKGATAPSTRLAAKTESKIAQKGDKALVSNKNTEIAEKIETPKNESKDLTSPKNKARLTSMEELINNGKLKPKTPAVDVQANTREEVPRMDEADENKVAEQQFITNKIGKSHQISIVLDQHFYKPYANEDSMAYEMLALDLKKEVERAIGNAALVSQISFSEAKNPGKLPSYSHVLAKFTLNGDENKLHDAVKKGSVGGMMVDKHFFQTS